MGLLGFVLLILVRKANQTLVDMACPNGSTGICVTDFGGTTPTNRDRFINPAHLPTVLLPIP